MPEKIFTDNTATIWCADSLQHPGLWTGADVLVTDPPYGIDWKQGDTKPRHCASDRREGIVGDRDTVARDTALELWGVGRPAVVFGSPMIGPPPGTRQALVFLKGPNSGMHGAMAGCRRDVEMIYLVGAWPSGIGGRSSVFTTRSVTGTPSPQAKYQHPHAKPVDMLEELLDHVLGGRVVVADPFAGSGSVLVAARGLGHKVVGVEVVRGHAVTAGRRLAQGMLGV